MIFLSNSVKKKFTPVIIFLLAALISGFLILKIKYLPSILYIKTESSITSNGQLFYSTGQGFNESQSFRFRTIKANTFFRHFFLLPSKTIDSLRIDPTDQKSEFTIKFIKVIGIKGIKTINPTDLVQFRQLTPFKTTYLFSGTSIGNDPSITAINFNQYNQLDLNTKLFLLLFWLILLFLIIKFNLLTKFIKILNLFAKKLSTNSAIYKITIVLLFLWFLFQVTFFAFSIKYDVFPDESFHYGLIQYFNQNHLIVPVDKTSSYVFGPVSTSPYLYYLITSKLLSFNFFLNPVFFVRIISIILGIISFYFSYKLVKYLIKDNLTIIFIFLILTNSLMYVYMSAAITYDCFSTTAAILSTYYLIKFIDFHKRSQLLLIILFNIIGLLSKVAFLPFTLSTFLIIIFNLKSIKNLISQKLTTKEIIIILLIIPIFILCSRLYIHNLVIYHSFIPSPEKVIGYDNSLKYYPEFQRNIKNYPLYKDVKLVPFYQFFIDYIKQTIGTIFGILGNKSLVKYGSDRYLYLFILIISTISLLFNIKKIFSNQKLKSIFFLSITYLTIVFFTNYQTYIHTHQFGLALAGRYNFPVYVSILIILSYTLLVRLKNMYRLIVILLLLTPLIANGFIWFFTNASIEWFI